MEKTFSLKEFMTELKNCVDANMGQDTYCSVKVEMNQFRRTEEPKVSVTAYFEGNGHIAGNSPEDVMNKVRNIFTPENQSVIKDVEI